MAELPQQWFRGTMHLQRKNEPGGRVLVAGRMTAGPATARPRIAILKDAFIPEYRVRLYEHLGQMREVEYVIFHGEAPGGTGHRAATGPFSFPEVRVRGHELRIGGKTLVYQSAVKRMTGPGFHGAVIGAELKLLANTLLFPLLKLRGRPVLLWGQGFEKQEDRGVAMRRLSRGVAPLKRAAARRADGYLTYTAGGRDHLVDAGVDPGRVSVLGNTLDLEAEIEAQRRVREESEEDLRKGLGLSDESIVLLFVGRVYREKRLSEFVSALRALQDRGPGAVPVEGLVVGDGPDLARVVRDAKGLSRVRFLGEVRDREEVARCMRVASAVVIPGAVGLAVNHAFAHGVPVITREGRMHGPEFEYLEPGRNSIVAGGDFDDFVRSAATFVDSADCRRALAAGAMESRNGLSVEAMADSFHHAVCRTLNVSL
jgi:glycosyltransferase involved in cell wall biosynthesis